MLCQEVGSFTYVSCRLIRRHLVVSSLEFALQVFRVLLVSRLVIRAVVIVIILVVVIIVILCATTDNDNTLLFPDILKHAR